MRQKQRDFTQTPNSANRDARLTPADFKVYVALISHDYADVRGDKKGVVFPSYTTLMHETALSMNAVRNGVRNLATFGYIRVKWMGRHAVNHYTILPLPSIYNNPTPLVKADARQRKREDAEKRMQRRKERQGIAECQNMTNDSQNMTFECQKKTAETYEYKHTKRNILKGELDGEQLPIGSAHNAESLPTSSVECEDNKARVSSFPPTVRDSAGDVAREVERKSSQLEHAGPRIENPFNTLAIHFQTVSETVDALSTNDVLTEREND